MDFVEAFDLAAHDILVKKFVLYRINRTHIRWLKNQPCHISSFMRSAIARIVQCLFNEQGLSSASQFVYNAGKPLRTRFLST